MIAHRPGPLLATTASLSASAALFVALTGCGGAEPAMELPSATDAPVQPDEPVPAPEPPPGGAPLDTLSAADVDGAGLTGELACSFSTASSDLLLLARGNVASASPAEAVVKVSGAAQRVTAQAGGGFDAMLSGATFVGPSATVVVAVTDETPIGGGESPPRAATLTMSGAEGAPIVGLWTCGP